MICPFLLLLLYREIPISIISRETHLFKIVSNIYYYRYIFLFTFILKPLDRLQEIISLE